MKRLFGITSVVFLSLMQLNSNASFFTGGPSSAGPAGNSSSSTTTGSQRELVELDSEAPAQAAPVCERGNAVSYNFIKEIARGGVDIELVEDDARGDYVRVSVKKYIKACMDGLDIKVSNIDNNVVIKFEVVNPKLVDGVSASDNFEKRYLKCLEKEIGDKRSYDELNQAGLISHTPFVDTISLSNFDATKDSKVVIAYPEQTESPFDGYRTGSGVSVGDTTSPAWNCMKTEDVAKNPLKVIKSVRSKALEACENNSLADIQKLREQISKDSTGNMSQLLSVLGEVEKDLLEKEGEKLLAELEHYENELGDLIDDDLSDDNKEAKDNKEEAKEVAKEYMKLLEKIEKDILPSYENLITTLLEERKTASSERKDEIDLQIRELNERVVEFARDKGDSKDSFKRAAKALGFYGITSAGKKLIKVNHTAKLLGRLYKDGKDGRDSKISLTQYRKKKEKEVPKLTARLLKRWKSLSDCHAGKKACVTNQKLTVSTLKKKKALAQKEQYKQYQLKSKYFNDWKQGYYKRYCQGWNVNYQKCQAATQQIQMTGYQYNMAQQNSWMKFNKGLNAQYDPIIKGETALLNQYTSLYQDASIRNEQRRFEQMRLGNTDFLGASDPLGAWFSNVSATGSDLDAELLMLQNNTSLGDPSSTMYFNPMLMNMP